ncbi:MAG TPA: hypothetical protein HA255_07125 [Methanosphaera sp.]|nr:hypothetical protein [Methanosphaera sp.]
MNEEQKKYLVRTIEEAGEWERIETSVDGLFVVKPPEYNNRQTVFVEIIPSINGQAIKKKGIYLKSTKELEACLDLLNNPKTKELLDVITEYYGKRESPKIEI